MREASYGWVVVGIGVCSDKDIVIPSTFNSKPVVEIREEAFTECRSITSVTIPGNIKVIGDKAFHGCHH